MRPCDSTNFNTNAYQGLTNPNPILPNHQIAVSETPTSPPLPSTSLPYDTTQNYQYTATNHPSSSMIYNDTNPQPLYDHTRATSISHSHIQPDADIPDQSSTTSGQKCKKFSSIQFQFNSLIVLNLELNPYTQLPLMNLS